MAEVYNWPLDLAPSTFGIKLKTNKKGFTSPFNNSTQDAYYPGAQWKVTMTFTNQDDYEARLLETCLHQLELGGRLRVPDFGRPGVNRTGITVFGSGQTGATLVTQGWPVNTIKVMLRGDYFEVGDELKILLEDVNSDAAGRATFKFSPWLRNSYPSGTTVTVKNPCGYFKLPNDENGVERAPGFVNGVTVELLEAFY